MKKLNHKAEIIKIFRDLATEYPNQPLSLHICLATADYATLDGITDKNLYFLMEKYQCEKALDIAPQLSEEEFADDFMYTLPDEDDV